MIKIKTETKVMKVCLMQFDRLLHKNKIYFCSVNNCWAFYNLC